VRGELRYRVGTLRRRLAGWQPYPPTVDVHCALCGSSRRETVGRRVAFEMRYRTVLCLDCGLVYLSPRPDDGAFADFYEHLYPRLYGKEEPAGAPTRRGVDVMTFLGSELDLSTRRGIFDVGCGDAGLLRAAARAAPQLRLGGCEPGWPGDGDAVLREGDAEIAIFKQPFEAFEGDLSHYDVYVLYDVIEHLLDARAFLETLHERGPADACLFVSTSCLDNWRDVPPSGWESYYLRLAHTYVFTARTLGALLEGTGWRVRVQQPAPKGDQWVLAERAAPRPAALAAAPAHADEVREMIAGYRELAGR
jgi:hypothetical protein